MLARAFAQVVKVKGKIGNISIGSYILDFWIAMTKSKLLNKYQCWKLMWWVHTSAVSLSLIISLFHFFFLNGFFILWDSLVNGEWTWLWKWERVCVYVLYTRHCLPLDASFEKLVTLSLSSPLVSVLPIRIQNRVLSLSFPLNNQTRRDSPHSPLLPRATCRVLLPDVSSRVYDRTIWDGERNDAHSAWSRSCVTDSKSC